MQIEYRIYHLVNDKWEIALYSYKALDRLSMIKEFNKWYKDNPYAKRVGKTMICSDYRIDQQRPQRDVRSDAYIVINSMTELEERLFDGLIEGLESKIDYPTTWDDGENTYYEETIYCPNCGERRKVLTSHNFCEFCGFEFSKAVRCPECNGLNLKGADKCRLCDYEFRKESFINNNEFEVKKNKDNEIIRCPECKTLKSRYFDTCQKCGYDFKHKKECPHCKELIDDKDNYCMYCGQKQIILIECKDCHKEIRNDDVYCKYCGQKQK